MHHAIVSQEDCTSSGGPACGNGIADMWFEVTSTQAAFVLMVDMNGWSCQGAVGVFDVCGGSLLQCSVIPPFTGAWDVPVILPAGTYKIRIQTQDYSGPGSVYCGPDGPLEICAWEGICADMQVSLAHTAPSCGEINGSVTVNPSGGGTAYTYNWSNGGNTQTIQNIGSGTYTVTVTSNIGCTKSGSRYVPTAIDFTLILDSTPPMCGLNNGIASVILNDEGGTPGLPAISYNFEWSNGSNMQYITGLAPGTYHVTVTGTAFNHPPCVKHDSIIVPEQPTLSLTTSDFNGFGISCSGALDGSVSASAPGSTPGYFYIWSTGETTPTISSLASGTYSVTLTDELGCTQTQSATLTEPPALVVDDIASGGQSNGSIEVSASGGVLPYQYNWTNSAGVEIGEQPAIWGLPAGTYNLLLTDANGCKLLTTYTIESVSKTKDHDLENRIQLFPNPTSGQVTLLLENPTVSYLSVEVFDALGKRVASHPKVEIVHGSGGLDFSGYAPGYYLVRMVIGDQAVVKRLAVSR
ncbi:MAG: T9SS type A sorting domain-containing protein [Saprospiraceae bacterium]|nr:T9SS type A sorting domain-containing protein [Saprospiraceae bacterium]